MSSNHWWPHQTCRNWSPMILRAIIWIVTFRNVHARRTQRTYNIEMTRKLGLSIHWTSNYGTGIVFIGNILSWLSFHNFVWWSLNAHISIISPNIWDLFSKSNSSVYYIYQCSIIFKENLTVFVNINKKPKYPFQLFLALLAEIHQKFIKNDGITSILLIVT